MTNLSTSVPQSLSRVTNPIKRIPIKKQEKFDYEGITNNHKPTTGIIEKIKNADPNHPWYEEITPEKALDMLLLNDSGHNRPKIEKDILLDVEQMKTKHWKQKNGDTLVISKSFKLLNGQHRLWSIYRSGISCIYLIVTGIDDDAFQYIDLQRRRNASHITSINGFQINANQLAYVVKAIILFKNKSIVKGNITEYDIHNYEVNNFQQNRHEMGLIAKDLDYAKHYWMTFNKNFFTAPQWAFAFYIFRSLPDKYKEAKEFMDRFADSNELKANNPIKIAHNYFTNEFKHLPRNKLRNKGNKVDLTIKFKTLIAAWNASIRKEKVSELRIDLETDFVPKPIYRTEL